MKSRLLPDPPFQQCVVQGVFCRGPTFAKEGVFAEQKADWDDCSVQSLHTAMADIKQSLEQLRYYKTTVFKSKPRR